jgi:hypothetical protein
MRIFWCILGLILIVASGYLLWFKAAERAAQAPETFLNLVALLALLCGMGGGIALGRGLRRVKP